MNKYKLVNIAFLSEIIGQKLMDCPGFLSATDSDSWFCPLDNIGENKIVVSVKKTQQNKAAEFLKDAKLSETNDFESYFVIQNIDNELFEVFKQAWSADLPFALPVDFVKTVAEKYNLWEILKVQYNYSPQN